MKTFTFFHCQLQRGLQMTQFVPPNDAPLRGEPKEVLFLGQYGKKYENGPSNIARNINLDKDNPAIVEETLESRRIIFNPFNRNEPSYSQKTCRIVTEAYPRKIFRFRANGSETFFVVLSKPLQSTRNILVRVNTSSPESITRRRGCWYRVFGKPSSASHARGVREKNGFVNVSWNDDLIVLHDKDVIRVVTEGSEEIDDQVLINMSGYLVMTPAASFYMSGINPEPMDAESIEEEMTKALSEQDFIPEENVRN